MPSKKTMKKRGKKQKQRKQIAVNIPSNFSAYNPPMTQPVRLNFVTNVQMNLLNTDYRQLYQVYVNDWYQPIGSSRQPNFYDFWASNYQHYVAQSCVMNVKYGGMNTVPLVFGVTTWPDIAVTVPNAPGIISLLSQYPKVKTKIIGPSPSTSCVGSMQYTDPLIDMYARYPSTTTNQFQMKVKAPTNSAHPFPMQYLLFIAAVSGGTPTSTQSVQFQIELTYSGYFTDRANSYDSITVQTKQKVLKQLQSEST